MTLRQLALLAPLFAVVLIAVWMLWLRFKYAKQRELDQGLEELVRLTDKAVATSQADGPSEQVRGPLR